MATAQSREKLQGPLKRFQGSSQAAEANHAISTIRFALQQDDQRVTVFDSSIPPEPFLDSVELENLKKRQQKAEEMSSRSSV
ncbi:hypothetical protein PV08_03314 [Exophiala spinifera]|uniref:Uncharacterized protein n=1 Tax=Exophiala spinifera TaxID=91928 RepID=A0A0D2C677_9EURO|nr:uncharacterized protein PV08_03314 [Exophiala spinifera]KIW19024.1 hypothetical protein PV08_03314 [Exophiala spinifera]